LALALALPLPHTDLQWCLLAAFQFDVYPPSQSSHFSLPSCYSCASNILPLSSVISNHCTHPSSSDRLLREPLSLVLDVAVVFALPTLDHDQPQPGPLHHHTITFSITNRPIQNCLSRRCDWVKFVVLRQLYMTLSPVGAQPRNLPI